MTSPKFSAAEFADKWRDNARRERASSQEHFIDLCRLLGIPTPNEADPSGEWYTFEAGAERLSTGSPGWADVWKRGHFGWEYKGDHADLVAAYRQLVDYREDLENPPALVVSDMDRIEVHTNFTRKRPQIFEITLDDLAAGGDRTAEAHRILLAVMTDPDSLEPTQTPDEVTQSAASQFAVIARSMQDRGHNPEQVAHFLNRVLFCLFAEDVKLLPKDLVSGLIASRSNDPAAFTRGLSEVFHRMSDRNADRYFGNLKIDWFNGGLFENDSTLDLTQEELRAVADASRLDWSQVEPAILGTLFERGLDPDKRGQLGAHYTDREKILMVVEPVVMKPLRREFAAMQERVAELMKDREPSPLTREGRRRANLPRWEQNAEAEWRAFLDRLRAVRVLDPACGSGNFLYVTLRLLKDLEQQAVRWGARRLQITGEFPLVGPHNVLGIEINPYARELASVAIWIGHIQWMIGEGYGSPSDPVLQPLDNIELRNAILKQDPHGNPLPIRGMWPPAEYIVGNPPFLGAKKLRKELGNEHAEALFAAWGDSVAGMADLCCYWHELARGQVLSGQTARVGLLATNSIRGGKSRQTLDNIKESGDIFMAWSDEPWVVEGDANVRVSIVGQDDGTERNRVLNGNPVEHINRDLTTGPDATYAIPLNENDNSAFIATVKGGAFDVAGTQARAMLELPANVNGRPNSDVIVPWVNSKDITDRPAGKFIIDFGTDMNEDQAAEYEIPFRHVEQHVKPVRSKVREARTRKRWWLMTRPIPGMRSALESLPRFLATPTVAKHRVFVWLSKPTLPDHQLVAIARDDDYAFGVLHSRLHEIWSLRLGTSLEDRPRYTPTTTFETFPFPWPLDTPNEALTPDQRRHCDAIGEAARELDEKRHRWLNPPVWVREVPDVIPSLPPRLLPVDEQAEQQLKKRTLTNLYNERPTWLVNLHANLDAAVCAAYGYTTDIGDEAILQCLLALNRKRASL